MIIIQDSREQKSLEFNHPWVTETKVEKLDVGDYAVEFLDGFRPRIVFERKSISDLYGTMTSGYPRFKECIRRAQESETTLFVIVEGTLSRVLLGHKHSMFEGASMVKKLFTIFVRYGVQTIFCKNREEMSQYIIAFYLACGREYVRKKKNNV